MMNIHPIDSKMYHWKFGTAEMRSIWSEEALIQSWLDVEAALAICQSELGIIPEDAAKKIAKHATTDQVSVCKVAQKYKQTNLDSAAMIKGLTEVLPDSAAQYVHWGATTTDITETGLSLQIRSSLRILHEMLKEIKSILIDLIEEHKDTIMVARTHSQHALPTTLGHKLSYWGIETQNLVDSLENIESSVCVGKISGAAGTYASFDGQGTELEQSVCNFLELSKSDITIQVSNRRIKKYINNLNSIATTYQQISNEIWNRQRTEINELREPIFGDKSKGSSTLAFKRNPLQCEWVRGISSLVKHNSNAIKDLSMEDERDGTRFAYYRALVPTTSVMTAAILSMMDDILRDLEVDTTQMDKNIEISNGFIMSEHVMMEIAQSGAGKQQAYDIISKCAAIALKEDLTLTEALERNEEVFQYIEPNNLPELTNPENYIGDAKSLVDETLNNLRNS